MNNIEGFDAHCHIFNLSYALREIKAMLFDKLTGRYPDEVKPVFKGREDKERSDSDFRKKLFRLLELFTSTVRNEKSNLYYLQKKTREAWGINTGAIPMMMDIYYFFAPPVTEETTQIPVKRFAAFKTVSLDESRFEEEFMNEAKKFVSNLKKKNRGQVDFHDLEKDLDRCMEDSHDDSGFKFEVRSPLYGKLKMTSGYLFHLERLRRLAMEGEPVYPFLAVDPRRPGILDALSNENLISRKGPFYGIKLYPRLGYHPASKPVQDIFDICIERDLPVTTHCGMSGFPCADFSFDGSGVWKYNDYGNPEHFEPALKKGLRINFAHLGSCDPDFKWAKTIVGYMKKYKNVYSDLSCYTGREEIEKIKALFGKSKIFKERILYGSDFDVMSFTDNKISLEQYCLNFSDLFPKEIKNMRYRNVLKFLNI